MAQNAPESRLIAGFDYLLRYFQIQVTSVPTGTLSRINPDTVLSLAQFSYLVANYFDRTLTKTPNWCKKVKEVEQVFGFEFSFENQTKKISTLRCLNQLELYLISTALIYSTECSFAEELVQELGVISTRYLTQQTGKAANEFDSRNTNRLVRLLMLYLPQLGQREFRVGTSFVLPPPNTTLTWDEHEFILEAFIQIWRKYHGKN